MVSIRNQREKNEAYKVLFHLYEILGKANETYL